MEWYIGFLLKLVENPNANHSNIENSEKKKDYKGTEFLGKKIPTVWVSLASLSFFLEILDNAILFPSSPEIQTRVFS